MTSYDKSKALKIMRQASLQGGLITWTLAAEIYGHHDYNQNLGKILKFNFDRVGKNLYFLPFTSKVWMPATKRDLAAHLSDWDGRAIKRRIVPADADYTVDWRPDVMIAEDFYAL